MEIKQNNSNIFEVEFTDEEMEILEKTERLKPKGAIVFLSRCIQHGLDFLRKSF